MTLKNTQFDAMPLPVEVNKLINSFIIKRKDIHD